MCSREVHDRSGFRPCYRETFAANCTDSEPWLQLCAYIASWSDEAPGPSPVSLLERMWSNDVGRSKHLRIGIERAPTNGVGVPDSQELFQSWIRAFHEECGGRGGSHPVYQPLSATPCAQTRLAEPPPSLSDSGGVPPLPKAETANKSRKVRYWCGDHWPSAKTVTLYPQHAETPHPAPQVQPPKGSTHLMHHRATFKPQGTVRTTKPILSKPSRNSAQNLITRRQRLGTSASPHATSLWLRSGRISGSRHAGQRLSRGNQG